MSTQPLQTPDFWRVNSYGYPNYFSDDVKAQEAWATFTSFAEHHESSYDALKKYWGSNKAPRRLDSHAVESWKATFEEFGLLYVISRSDQITITPGGFQLLDAATQNDHDAFVWTGLNLLFRYPLKGPPRRRRNAAHSASDVLPYRFLYAAMRDLGDYFWWTELERVFCRVFQTTEAVPAVQIVREWRSDASKYSAYPLPVAEKKGAFYNSLNQVANHAGMNHLTLLQDNESEHYGASESKRRHYIDRQFLSLVSVALGDTLSKDCRTAALYVERLPTAPSHEDEVEYFTFLGASVQTFAAASGVSSPQAISVAGDVVFVLSMGEHCRSVSVAFNERIIEGASAVLCQVARNHRVILSDDLTWTYLVVGKSLTSANAVRLVLRRARPITNVDPIHQVLGRNHG
jgi:hypothetical protein